MSKLFIMTKTEAEKARNIITSEKLEKNAYGQEVSESHVEEIKILLDSSTIVYSVYTYNEAVAVGILP